MNHFTFVWFGSRQIDNNGQSNQILQIFIIHPRHTTPHHTVMIRFLSSLLLFYKRKKRFSMLQWNPFGKHKHFECDRLHAKRKYYTYRTGVNSENVCVLFHFCIYFFPSFAIEFRCVEYQKRERERERAKILVVSRLNFVCKIFHIDCVKWFYSNGIQQKRCVHSEPNDFKRNVCTEFVFVVNAQIRKSNIIRKWICVCIAFGLFARISIVFARVETTTTDCYMGFYV